MRAYLYLPFALAVGRTLFCQTAPDLTIAAIDTALVSTDSQSLRISGVLRATLTNLGTAPTAGRFRVLAFEDTNRSGRYDAGVDRILGSADFLDLIPVGARSVTSIPLAGVVSFRGNHVLVFVDSERAISETNEENNVFSTAQNSTYPGSGPFTAALKWSWTSSPIEPGKVDVISTPAVIDINQDGVPDVIFSSGTSELNYVSDGFLRAVSGKDGSEIFTANQTSPVDLRVNALSSFAVGDIDGDGRPEIVAVDNSGSRLIAFEHNGTFKWRSSLLDPIIWGGPSIVDVDHDGTPEILVGRTILNSNGTVRWTGSSGRGGYSTLGPLSFAADIDLDGQVELVAGNTVYEASGAVKYVNPSLPDGLTAAGNFDSDSMAEIVLVANGSIWLLEHNLSVKWGPVAIPGGGLGGAPTIADFNNDGQAEIGIAGSTQYVVFDSNGNVRWTSPIQDGSSVTGSSVFDFDGDGASEIVYADQQFLYVFRGSDGQVLLKIPKSSGTAYEYPIIVDVDGDGRADIVTTANTNGGFGPQRGLFVYSANNWANTRRIWNQHAFHITNVNDDGTIPRFEQANWLTPGLNNFRLNTFTQPGLATATPDFTSSYIRKTDSTFPSAVQLTARIGNGGGVAPQGVSPNLLINGSFDESSPLCPLTYVNRMGATPPQDTFMPGWKITAGQIDQFGTNYWTTADGRCAVNIDGDFGTSGRLEQVIATEPGALYEFSWQMSGHPGGGLINPLRVIAAGQSADFDFDSSAGTAANLGWKLYKWQFRAIAASTTVVFQSLTTERGVAPGLGANIDDAAVRLISHANGGAPSNVSVSFYRGDPASGGTLIGTTLVSRALAPGEFEDVSTSWNNPAAGLHSIFVVADDPAQVTEGNEANNKSGTQILLGSGPFPLVDELLTRQKDSSVDLSWVAIPGATGYNIYRKTATTSPQLVRSNHAGISFTDTGLTNGTPVLYTVRWKNAQGVESADGTEASATPAPTGATGANAPTISSRAATRAVVGQSYAYQLRAGDPDPGTVLSYSLVSPPAGMVISNTGLITWTPAQAQAGYSRIQVRVQDNTARFATQAYSLFAEVQTIINNPPVISSTPIRNATSGTAYAYQVVGSDPDGSFLAWSLDAAPLGMSINQATGLVQWTPTRDHVGSQNAVVRLTDIGGLTATQAFAITVARGNRAPSFLSSALTIARAGEQYQYPATATDPENDPLTYSLIGGPAGMVVNATTGLVTWTPAINLANTSVPVTLRVVDNGNLAATQAYTLRVTAPNQPPVITSNAVTKAAVGSAYAYQVVATDPNSPNDQLTYSLTAAPAGMAIHPATGLIQWLPPANLLNTTQNVTVRVVDLGGLQATQSFVIQVGPAGSDLPSVSLISPVNGATLTADAPLIGTVTDPNLRLWRVEYQRPGDSAWYPISSGTTPVTNGSLGTLPATLIANDAYRLRLYAENTTGSITTPDIGTNVDTKQLKMGDFTLAFEDLRVPGFTFPISIMRRYDSKRPQSGDFGRGWTLGFSEVDVRLDANGNVFLTLPDARRVSFTYTPECISPLFGSCAFGAYKTVFTAQNGVYDKLETLDCLTTTFGGCSLGGPFNPQRWLLTTRENLKYTIENGKVTRMEDRSGNWMQISATGVTSSTGRNVVFERNPQGLITKIKEPSPGGELRYEYDAQDRLLRWINLSGKTTTFFYENASFPHYLTRIVDPLGRNALRNVFNAEGRLVAQCDANGDINTLVGCSQFNPQPGTKTFSAINGRGFKTELVTDDRGNVLSERRYLDAINHLDTIRTYDVKNNMLTERDPEGNLKTYTYDARGNRLTETDPGGRTTTYTYATGCDKVETTKDPAGNVTRNTYDDKCNLRFLTDALLKTTEYRYNSFGQRTQMIDPNGTTWTWNYLPNGLLQNLVDPFGKAATFSFDGKGNLLSRTDRNNRRIDFQYDASNRLTRETWDNGRVTNYSYDDLGALLTAADPDSSLTMTYDSLGRLNTVDNLGTPGAPRVLMSYSYDANGNTTLVQDSLGGFTYYSYDALDRLSRVTQSGTGVQPKRVDMTYSPASLLTQLKRFSDLAGTLGVANTNYEYDCGGCAGRVTAIRHRKASDNSVIHDMTFVRDPLGNILNSTDAEGAHGYTYDPVRRLLSATHPPGGVQPNEFYTYDAVGNRLASHVSHVYTYSWQTQGKGNRLLQDNQFDYRYDEEGNLVRRTNRSTGEYTDFTYDHRNRLATSVERTVAGIAFISQESAYDILSRRIRFRVANQTLHIIHDGMNPVMKLDASGVITTRRLYGLGLDQLLSYEIAKQTMWPLFDPVGSTRDVVDIGVATANRITYDSFGNTLRVLGSSSINDVTFAGREFEGGLGYFRYRLYLPQIGRWTQEDPLSSGDYAYSLNQPLTNRDPLGLISDDSIISIYSASIRNVFYKGLTSGRFAEFNTQLVRLITDLNKLSPSDPQRELLVRVLYTLLEDPAAHPLLATFIRLALPFTGTPGYFLLQ